MGIARVAPLAALLLTATPVLGQQAVGSREGYKDPGTATIIGLLIPGGGQLWLGDPGVQRKGFTILGVGYLAPIVGAIVTAEDGSLAPVLVGVAASLAAGVYGAATAAGDAREHNRRLGGRIAVLARVQPVLAPGRRATTVGFSLRF